MPRPAFAALACCLATLGAGAARPRQGGVETSTAATASPPADRTAEMRRADIDTLLMAHRVAPEEKLALRLLGVVGPDGSWALECVDVERQPGRVVVQAHVRQTPGENVIQMLMPLDYTVHLKLPPGRYRIEALGERRTLADTLVVEPGARRPPPGTQIHQGDPVGSGAGQVVPVEILGSVADGFVASIEVRESVGTRRGDWRRADSVRRQGQTLRAWVQLPRPARSGAKHLFEARAVDGQGVADPAPAAILLP